MVRCALENRSRPANWPNSVYNYPDSAQIDSQIGRKKFVAPHPTLCRRNVHVITLIEIHSATIKPSVRARYEHVLAPLTTSVPLKRATEQPPTLPFLSPRSTVISPYKTVY